TYVYDANDNLVDVTAGQSTKPAPVGLAAYAQEVRTTYAYDRLDQKVGQTEAVGQPEQRRSEFRYTTAGTPFEQRVGLSDTPGYAFPVVSRIGYDVLGRKTEMVEAVGTQEQRRGVKHYDAAGNVVSGTANIGDAPNNPGYDKAVTTTFSYDALNRARE